MTLTINLYCCNSACLSRLDSSLIPCQYKHGSFVTSPNSHAVVQIRCFKPTILLCSLQHSQRWKHKTKIQDKSIVQRYLALIKCHNDSSWCSLRRTEWSFYADITKILVNRVYYSAICYVNDLLRDAIRRTNLDSNSSNWSIVLVGTSTTNFFFSFGYIFRLPLILSIQIFIQQFVKSSKKESIKKWFSKIWSEVVSHSKRKMLSDPTFTYSFWHINIGRWSVL